VPIEVLHENGETLEAHAYLIPARLLTPELPRIGPLPEYTPEHARLYRKRAA
jgi:hypothetical protein